MDITLVDMIPRLCPGNAIKGTKNGRAIGVQQDRNSRRILETNSLAHRQLDVLRGDVTSDSANDPGGHSVSSSKKNGGNCVERNVIVGTTTGGLPTGEEA